METDVKLTKLASCAGCGAKVGAGTLVKMLEGFRTHTDPRLIVGYDKSDDASVYVVSDDTAIVQTTDFFPPIVDDPFLYGQIAATNALSDVYAMGGAPKLALNIMCLADSMDDETVREILRGGYDKAYEAGVIITGSEIYTGRIKDKFEPVVRAKLAHYPGEILGVTICDDDLNMIVDTAKGYLAQGADFLIFTGGMSVDPDDLTPTAIRQLGAEIITHGVPAQPGNMTLVAYLGDVPILGVPGAAISMPTTIFDVLLPQIYAGDRLTHEDLIRLGDGGLCRLCKPCHFPTCTFGRY